MPKPSLPKEQPASMSASIAAARCALPPISAIVRPKSPSNQAPPCPPGVGKMSSSRPMARNWRSISTASARGQPVSKPSAPTTAPSPWVLAAVAVTWTARSMKWNSTPKAKPPPKWQACRRSRSSTSPAIATPWTRLIHASTNQTIKAPPSLAPPTPPPILTARPKRRALPATPLSSTSKTV